MEKSRKDLPRKRTQRDYTHAFKLQVVSEIERGEMSQNGAQRKYGIQGNATVGLWVRKYGNFDRTYALKRKKMKSPEQRIMELEQKVKLLEKQKRSLEHELKRTDKKALFFDMMIDIAEEEFKIRLEKSPCPINQNLQNRTPRNGK